MKILIAGGIFALAIGCAEEPIPAAPKQAVYFDTATKQPIVAPIADETPAMHPETGKRTLMPALYCPKCQTWHAVPPIDQINRSPGATKCLKTGTEMVADGPWP